MPSYTDFELPGLQFHPDDNRTLTSTIAVAYSTLANPRRLEDPLYSFWNKMLLNLVHGSGIAVCPQYRLYKDAKGKPRPDSSAVTNAGTNDGDLIPDFTLLGIYLANRETGQLLQYIEIPDSFVKWESARVVLAKPLSLWEIKRMAGRHCSTQEEFQKALIDSMTKAIEDVENQAELMFTEKAYNADRLVLVAISGEWWRFRFARRSEFMEPSGNILGGLDGDDDDDDDDAEYDENMEKLTKQMSVKGSQKKKGKAQEAEKKTKTNKGHLLQASTSKDKASNQRAPKMQRYTKIDAKYMDVLQNDVQRARPRRWSKYILYGTPESNQRMFLIHDELDKMVRDLQPEAQTNLDRWAQAGYKSDGTEDEESEDELNRNLNRKVDDFDEEEDEASAIREVGPYVREEQEDYSGDSESSDEINTLPRQNA